MHINDKLDPNVNVTIKVYEDGLLIDHRRSHNVVTNVGREWLARLVGSDNYDVEPPSPHVTAKAKYIGFGCGGVLQTSNDFARSQSELVTVTHLEDPIPFEEEANVRTYLKQVDSQTNSVTYFPEPFRTRFILDIPESWISFAGNTTRASNVAVGTNVPISEAGLFLSTAKPTFSHNFDVPVAIEADPLAPNDMVAYNIFSPITITPNVVLRIEWELRF